MHTDYETLSRKIKFRRLLKISLLTLLISIAVLAPALWYWEQSIQMRSALPVSYTHLGDKTGYTGAASDDQGPCGGYRFGEGAGSAHTCLLYTSGRLQKCRTDLPCHEWRLLYRTAFVKSIGKRPGVFFLCLFVKKWNWGFTNRDKWDNIIYY